MALQQFFVLNNQTTPDPTHLAAISLGERDLEVTGCIPVHQRELLGAWLQQHTGVMPD